MELTRQRPTWLRVSVPRSLLMDTARPSFYQSYVKRPLDFAMATPLLLMLTIPMIVIAMAIRLTSPGPAIFRQRRIGKDGRPFTVLKFRTMIAVPGSGFQLFVCADGSARHKVPDDPRVTPLGRILRRTSLDELPQLINVIRSEMSLVGPRPELSEIVATYDPWQHERHSVRPGMTGSWQVAGRSNRPMHEHTELDIDYVRRLSFLLDMQILLKTVGVVVRGSGVY